MAISTGNKVRFPGSTVQDKHFYALSCTCPENFHDLCRKFIGNNALYCFQEIQHFSGNKV